MKKLVRLLVVAFSLAVLVSCQKEELEVNTETPDLIGNWINPIYIDTLVTYEKANGLIENQYGICFKDGNKLIERKINGWCGTPPVTTADYEGSWIRNNSTVEIAVGFWGGTAKYTWKVVELNKTKLVISVVKSSYQQEK